MPFGERLGIFQGRLVPSPPGVLQCSPGDRWREEFDRAGSLGLAHVELLAERIRRPTEPIWSVTGRAELRAVAAAHGVALVSLCCEEVLEVPLTAGDFAAGLAGRLATVVGDLGLEVVVLPLFEASDPSGLGSSDLAAALRVTAGALAAAGARTVLEVPLGAGACVDLLEAVGSPHVGLCYDLGNATAAGFEPSAELGLLGDRVWHVHAKDKDVAGANVVFGSGRVDFPAAFTVLARLGYTGRFTMEATRGDDPVATAAAHRDFLGRIAEAAGI